jgi:hypothetical protein
MKEKRSCTARTSVEVSILSPSRVNTSTEFSSSHISLCVVVVFFSLSVVRTLHTLHSTIIIIIVVTVIFNLHESNTLIEEITTKTRVCSHRHHVVPSLTR